MRKSILLATALLLTASGWANIPTIFWASDPIKPNETIMAQGDGLDGDTKLEIIKIDNKEITGAPTIKEFKFKGKAQSVSSLQPSAQTGKYVVPADWDLALYAIRPANKSGKGKETILNMPTTWWIQGDNVQFSTPDSHFSVFGKCLSYGDAQVYLEDANGKFAKAAIKDQDMWHIDVDLAGHAKGNYKVYVHNGLGGDYGWCEAGTIEIKEQEAWSTTVFNVVDYGAKPSTNPNRSILDETNDSPAFQRALDAAGAAGGGVVFVPMGCYRLVEELYVPKYVTIQGESMVSTNLGWVDREDALIGLINGTSNFAVKDISIFVQNYWSVIRGDHGHTPGSGNIFVERVTIRANRQLGIMNRIYPDDWVERQNTRQWNIALREAPLNFGGENIKIIDCDVIGSHNSIILDKASGIVANTKLYCPQTFQNSQYWIRGCSNLILVNNDIYGGGCMGNHNTSRGKHGTDSWEGYVNLVSENVYFAHNYQHDNWKWDREMMTLDSHGYTGPYVGPVAEGKGNTLVFPDVFPVLSVAGELTSVSGGPIYSQKKLTPGKEYKIIVRIESKEAAMDWDRSFVNFYDGDEAIEAEEPEISQRTGDSRYTSHGKVSGARIRGTKGFEIKEFRIADSWKDLQDNSKSKILFGKQTLNGKDTPTKETEVVYDFDADGNLYTMVTVVAKDAMTTGFVELMMDGNKPAISLGISRLGGNKVDFSTPAYQQGNQNTTNINLFKGAMVYVLEGKGCGQYRRILDGDGNTLTLDKPWDVELDETSVISLHRTHIHQIFTNNRFEDGGGAMLLYSGSIENIMANNTSVRTSGYAVTGLVASVSMYCQFLDNVIESGAGFGGPPFNLRGGRISVEPYRPVGYLSGFQAMGMVLRNNKLENMATVGIHGPVQNVLVESNTIANTQVGVIVDSEGMGSFEKSWCWPEDVLVRGNIFQNVETKLEADKEATVIMVE